MASAPSKPRLASLVRRTTVIALAITVAACSTSNLTPGRDGANGDALRSHASQSPITHVVFIIQENRSFNNLFMGFPGATTQNYGYDSYGDKIALQPFGLATGWDLEHDSTSFFEDCNGTGTLRGTQCNNNGWNLVQNGFDAPKNAAYSYVPKKQLEQYWKLAHQYVLADEMFPSNLDASFISHQYAISAYADRAVDSPIAQWGCEGTKDNTIYTLTKKRTMGPVIAPCFDIPSIGTEADKLGVSWRFYTGAVTCDGGIWSSYQANERVYGGPDWNTDVINPPAQFLSDLAAGKLANVTWITPDYSSSDHPGLVADDGPAWVASLVNAVGKSTFWSSTAVFIMWDDWGGWFDPVPPPFEDYDGLGFRVPLIVVSPYAKQGSVTHVQYETASVLRFIEDDFGLPQMAKSDARASDPANDPAVFDFTQKPRTYQKISGGKPASYWLKHYKCGNDERSRILGDD